MSLALLKKFILFAIAAVYLLQGYDLKSESRIFDEVVGADEAGNVQRVLAIKPTITLSKKEIYHYEILNVYLNGASDLELENLSIKVFKDGRFHGSADIEFNIPFFPDPGKERLKAVYLPGWNAYEGEYEIKLFHADKRIQTDEKITFLLKRKPTPPLERGIFVVDLEMNESVKKKSFIDPEGFIADYSAIPRWVQEMNADALWILSGETTTFQRPTSTSKPWDAGPLENLYLLKKIAGQYDIDIGAYIMCFYVPGNYGVPDRYNAGIGYNKENDNLYYSKHISLSSEQRVLDIIELAKQFQDDEQIQYIGFDFIRTGRADGYELGPIVVRDTNIITPRDWNSYSSQEKIKWFARKVEVEKDPLVIEKWRWWRAHKVAGIMKRIIEEAGITKPVWVYTLGWNHGKEHGQDPVMFFDAGVTIDAVMLYEANRQQFARLLEHWNNYIRAEHGNIIIGNCIDHRLLDSDSLSPPDELYRRNIDGYRNILRDGFASGIFLHDISRAFWGRRGNHTVKEYAQSFISSVQSLKNELQVLDLIVDGSLDDVIMDDSGTVEYSGHIILKNNGTESLKGIKVAFFNHKNHKDVIFYFGGTSYYTTFFEIPLLNVFESTRLDFTLIKFDGTSDIGKTGLKISIEDLHNFRIITLMDLNKSGFNVK